MCFKNATIVIFCFLTFNLFSQILIDDVGDGWKSKVDSALQLIKKTSPEHYNEVISNCTYITYWIGDFSTTVDSSTILLSVKEFKLNSITNLSCVIVHEAHHLYIKKMNFEMSPSVEESNCYKWEWLYVNKLENCEVWIKNHIIKCIKIYSEYQMSNETIKNEKETQN